MATMTHASAPAEQLSLLPTPSTPARFRLSTDTRRRGLRHVAEIRSLLAERAADQDEAERAVRSLPPRRAA